MMHHGAIKKDDGLQPKQVHIGCGDKQIPGFINVDIRDLPNVDHVASADDMPFFEDDSIDLIYCSHILEHFPRPRIMAVLNEWYRVLRPGGTLRIAVPDFENLVNVYMETKDLSLILGPLVGRQDYPENTHYMVFDFPTLKRLLEGIGFKNIRRYDWRETIHKDYDDFSQAYIPHMDKDNGKLISLNIECEK